MFMKLLKRCHENCVPAFGELGQRKCVSKWMLSITELPSRYEKFHSKQGKLFLQIFLIQASRNILAPPFGFSGKSFQFDWFYPKSSPSLSSEKFKQYVTSESKFRQVFMAKKVSSNVVMILGRDPQIISARTRLYFPWVTFDVRQSFFQWKNPICRLHTRVMRICLTSHHHHTP